MDEIARLAEKTSTESDDRIRAQDNSVRVDSGDGTGFEQGVMHRYFGRGERFVLHLDGLAGDNLE